LRIKATTALICAYLSAPTLSARVVEVHVVELKIDGIVHPVTAEIVNSALGQASREHAAAVLLTLSTPGGLMDSTRQIVEEILHSPVPVIVWVGPSGARAASAGFFLLESGDIAAMAPGTNTGASHPVSLSGEAFSGQAFSGQAMEPVMKQKVENDAAALLRSVVERRGRNVAAAEKTVRESVSYTDREALDNHLIDAIAPDPSSLLRQLEGREIKRFDGRTQTLNLQGAGIVPYQLSLRERVLSAIADPNIALLLLILGALGMYAEFSSPGLIAPGAIGSVLTLLGLAALALFPIDWLGAALILLGLIFFALEAKFGTHGILTAGGAIAMLFGSVMLIDTSVPELRIRWSTALAVTLPFALITSFLLSIALRARRNKVVTGTEAMLGQTGMTVGELNPSGTVMFHGEYWNAQASARVSAAEKVTIVGIDGLTLRVEPSAEPERK
jgi:membrane-bound serine protease (ClpP class)